MNLRTQTEAPFAQASALAGAAPPAGQTVLRAAILTGGFDRHYAYGLSMALVREGAELEVVGSDEVDSPEMHSTSGLVFLNLQRGWRHDVPIAAKIWRLLRYYLTLMLSLRKSQADVVHILWNGKFTHFDRTLLMVYLRALGKGIALTAHNVNTAKRDHHDSWFNRTTLWCQYTLSDRIFVHTESMRSELMVDFGVPDEKVVVIPYGINNAVPSTNLTRGEARRRLGIRESERTLLFFGRIQPYKGMEYLVEALELLSRRGQGCRLIIAGEPKKEYRQYWAGLQAEILRSPLCGNVLQAIRFIPDDETELYFRAADALALPYTDICQSGVLFLGYSFGLPVIATDLASFREVVEPGVTGFLCRAGDPADLARAVEEYFDSDLFRQPDATRRSIQEYAFQRSSWTKVARLTLQAYRYMHRPRRTGKSE